MSCRYYTHFDLKDAARAASVLASLAGTRGVENPNATKLVGGSSRINSLVIRNLRLELCAWPFWDKGVLAVHS
jgi:hypothetical protein